MAGINLKKHEKAYFTLEASLIMPMVMLFTVMMIFLAFYSYDRCILEHSAYEAALRGTSSHFDSAKEALEAADTAAKRLVEGKLFALHDFSYDVSVDGVEVTVSYHCVVNMPLMTWLSGYISDISESTMTLDIKKNATRCHQTGTIRTCRVVNKLIKDLK
jgi:hypothetical protein